MSSHDVRTNLYTYSEWLEGARLKNVHSYIITLTKKVHMKRLKSYIKFLNEF